MKELIINDWCKEIYQGNKEKGFWPEDRNLGEVIALIHAELSELLEALREPSLLPDKHLPHRSNAEVEAADGVIRLFDLAGKMGWPLGEIIAEKIAFNRTRPHKHGKKF